jgi:hypothetical protein
LIVEEVLQQFGDLGLQARGGFTLRQFTGVGVEAPTTEKISIRNVGLVGDSVFPLPDYFDNNQ